MSLSLSVSFPPSLPASLSLCPKPRCATMNLNTKIKKGWDEKKRQHAGGKSKISLSDKKKLGFPPYATFKVATCPKAGQSSTAAPGWPKNHKRKAQLLLKDPWIVWSYRGSPLPSWRKSLFKKDQPGEQNWDRFGDHLIPENAFKEYLEFCSVNPRYIKVNTFFKKNLILRYSLFNL